MAGMTDREAERLVKLAGVPGLATVPDAHRLMLLRFANEMAGFYQSPVYLCGSALAKVDPRDIDIRIQLADDEFGRRYGGSMHPEAAVRKWIEQGLTGDWSPIRWRWSSDCTKRCKHAWKLTNLNVDFQVYPASWCEQQYGNEPRLRLDEMPAPERLP
jgi:hypothetical protein